MSHLKRYFLRSARNRVKQQQQRKATYQQYSRKLSKLCQNSAEKKDFKLGKKKNNIIRSKVANFD